MYIFFITKNTDIIVIQYNELGSRFFHDTLDLSVYITSPTWFIAIKKVSPVEGGVLQNWQEVLRKMKEARKVARLEGGRHISHSVLTEIC